MKLRLHGDSIRLRLGQADVRTFAETGSVEERTLLGGGHCFHYSLRMDERAPRPTASMTNGALEVTLPRTSALSWARGEDVGIEHEERGEGWRLRITVEKDFACLHARVGGEDRDAFPRPAAG